MKSLDDLWGEFHDKTLEWYAAEAEEFYMGAKAFREFLKERQERECECVIPDSAKALIVKTFCSLCGKEVSE